MDYGWFSRALLRKTRAKISKSEPRYETTRFQIGGALPGELKGPKEALLDPSNLDPPIIIIIWIAYCAGVHRTSKGLIWGRSEHRPSHFPPWFWDFPDSVFFGLNLWNSLTFLKSVNNQQNLWVMTHDIWIYHTKLISFPLRFCWIWTFSSKNQIISGNQRFFGKKGWNSPKLENFTRFQILSGNEIKCGKM